MERLNQRTKAERVELSVMKVIGWQKRKVVENLSFVPKLNESSI